MRRPAGREEFEANAEAHTLPAGGFAGWLWARVRIGLRRAPRPRPRLALVERIALAPRQSLALVEAEGRRLLVVTSTDGSSAFFPLDGPLAGASHPWRSAHHAESAARRSPRVSW
jgi:Flagellar biosynthesis protein, FliO